MTVFRIHIRPRGGKGDSARSFDYCLKNKVLGMGWDVGMAKSLTWEAFVSKGSKKFPDDLTRVSFLHDKVRPNDLLWSRDKKGNYYLGKVKSGWEYLATPEAIDADVVNVCRCKQLYPVKLIDVPGKVIACFRPTRTIQRIKNETCEIYSQILWNMLSGHNDYSIPKSKEPQNIYSFLSAEECEDVLAIYLQTQGWYLIPNSRKADTMTYEYILIHSKTHEKAVAQVKTGGEKLNQDNWKNWRTKVFLFQTENLYAGISRENVECINPAVIEKFMRSNKDIMPPGVCRWLEYAGRI